MHTPSSLFVSKAVSLFLLFVATLPVFGQSVLWSDPTTWGGSVPTAGSTVTIPAGQTIILDIDPPALTGIRVEGTLEVQDRDVLIETGFILIEGGTFRMGSASAPFMSKGIITLTGDSADATGIGIGNKFILVYDGGRLELHGHRKNAVAWTQLKQHASPGQSVLHLAEPVNWRVGDKVVLAPSGTAPQHVEEFTVTGLDASGDLIGIDPPLTRQHFGRVQTVRGFPVDMRAEVGLLTRDIVIQGDSSSLLSRVGGHIMIMAGGHARVEGVEFRRMGWFGTAARYPLHWHFSGNSDGEYARDNSIHHCFHRGIVTHGSNNIRVERNVLFDTWSHGFVVSEEGLSTGNEYIDNLGLMIRRIENMDDFAFPDSQQFGSSQAERHPGVFWSTNPNNLIRGNHAAASVNGIGFFLDGVGTAILAPAPGSFTDNVAHSNYSDEGGYDRAHYRTKGWGLFVGEGLGDENPIIIDNFLGYKNTLGGAWLEGAGIVLKNSTLNDNGSGVNIQSSTLDEVVLIGRTDNNIAPTSKQYGAINVFSSFPHGTKRPVIQNLDVLRFPVMFNIEHENVDFMSSIQRVSTEEVLENIRIDRADFQGAIVDLRGEMRGTGKPTLWFGRDYPFAISACNLDSNARAQSCPANRYGWLEISSDLYSAPAVGDLELINATGAARAMYDARVIDSWLPTFGHRKTQWVPLNEEFDLNWLSSPGAATEEFVISLTSQKTGGVILKMNYPSDMIPRVILPDGSNLPEAAAASEVSSSSNSWIHDELTGQLTISITRGPGSSLSQLMVRGISARMSFTQNEVAAYPNPFSNELNLSFNSEYNNAETVVSLMDIEGRLVAQQDFGLLPQGPAVLNIPTDNLPEGVYTYRLQIGSRVETGTVIRTGIGVTTK